jgi:hypothetical protein
MNSYFKDLFSDTLPIRTPSFYSTFVKESKDMIKETYGSLM